MRFFSARWIWMLGGREPVALLALLCIVAGTWGFLELTSEVFEGETRAFDEYVLQALRNPDDVSVPLGPSWLHEAGRDITALGGVSVLVLVITSIAVFLWLERKKRMLLFLLGATCSGILVSSLLKSFFKRPRPDLVPHLAQVYTTSFPSGHALMSAVVYLTLAALLSSVVARRRLKIYILGLAVFFSVLVGLSRVYLGVHYPTDVLAGWAAGLVWALLCWSIAHWLQKRGSVEGEETQPSKGQRLSSFLGVLILSVGCSGCLIGRGYDIPVLSPSSPNYGLQHSYPAQSAQFRRVVGHLLGPPITEGNEIETLVNGDEIFPAMLSAIKAAEKSITFETYIYWDGKVGRDFAEALAERARAGVAVHVLLDWFGASKLFDSFVQEMKEAGVKVQVYNPLSWYNPFRWQDLANANYRTHRKLLVIDGALGFIGGVGIADLWSGNAENPDHWRETHYQVCGPVVAQMQSAFIDNWLEVGGGLLDGDNYFPQLSACGDVAAQAFKASPVEATAQIELMYRIAITAASRSIKIGTAYFVPNEGTLMALVRAQERGVEVELLLPGEHIDQPIVRTASRSSWKQLLEADVKVYEYQPTMYHAKLMIVDDYFVSIGSANFDNRSFHLNDEANLNVFDHRFAAQQAAQFERDKQRSKQITLEMWQSRPLWERAFERVVWFFRGEL